MFCVFCKHVLGEAYTGTARERGGERPERRRGRRKEAGAGPESGRRQGGNDPALGGDPRRVGGPSRSGWGLSIRTKLEISKFTPKFEISICMHESETSKRTPKFDSTCMHKLEIPRCAPYLFKIVVRISFFVFLYLGRPTGTLIGAPFE